MPHNQPKGSTRFLNATARYDARMIPGSLAGARNSIYSSRQVQAAFEQATGRSPTRGRPTVDVRRRRRDAGTPAPIPLAGYTVDSAVTRRREAT